MDKDEELTRLRTEVFILNSLLKEQYELNDEEPPFIGPERAPQYGPIPSWWMLEQRERQLWKDMMEQQYKAMFENFVDLPFINKPIEIKKEFVSIRMNNHRGEQ